MLDYVTAVIDSCHKEVPRQMTLNKLTPIPKGKTVGVMYSCIGASLLPICLVKWELSSDVQASVTYVKRRALGASRSVDFGKGGTVH
jgi:hypothetical protein